MTSGDCGVISASSRSFCGRGMLPTCVVKMRLSLRFIDLDFRSSPEVSGARGCRLRSHNRLERRKDFLAAILEPRRQMQFRTQLIRRFVLLETSGNVAAALDQDATG